MHNRTLIAQSMAITSAAHMLIGEGYISEKKARRFLLEVDNITMRLLKGEIIEFDGIKPASLSASNEMFQIVEKLLTKFLAKSEEPDGYKE